MIDIDTFVDPQQTSEHTKYMKQALNLATLAQGFTSPNPLVGAIVVKNNTIVGQGYHHQAGTPHAEVIALKAAGQAAKGATLYVTLEPCNHHGRTPPCTEAIINAGIAKVFYAVGDPNPQVNGNGYKRLLEANIQVKCGPYTKEAKYLNRFFFHFITHAYPYIIAKFASSLDGKIATHTGHSQWITGLEARNKGHELRQMCDAILIGANTAIADNPQLTTRLPQKKLSHPTRIVLDSYGRVPITSQLFNSTLPGKTIVATTPNANPTHLAALKKQNVEILQTPCTPSNQVDIVALLNQLGRREITSLIVEGGGQVLASFFEANLVNEVWAFIAPIIIGGKQAPSPVAGLGAVSLTDSFKLQDITIDKMGNDFLIRGIHS